MKSGNPHSGCRQVEVSKTLDCFDPSPAKNQGGIAVLQPVPYTLKIRSGCEGGGKGALIHVDKSATLSTHNDQYLFQPAVFDARGNGDGKTANTLTGDHENRVTDYTAVCVQPVAVDGYNQTISDKFGSLRAGKSDGDHVGTVILPCYCLQGNGIGRADTAGCNGKGWAEEVCYTLNTIDRPAVCYAMQGFGDYIQSEVGSTLTANEAKMPHDLCVTVQYIVRRLTPTECARLQGFPDCWGHPDRKDDFTDEEYQFWLTVRKTHAEINSKTVKEYTKAQMLKWYNGLHTDSAEYKMWGNGIALPTALYVMQGIADALRGDDAAMT